MEALPHKKFNFGESIHLPNPIPFKHLLFLCNGQPVGAFKLKLTARAASQATLSLLLIVTAKRVA